jgi:uncharacterized protein YjeT (DUF2065 family)
MSKLSGTAVRIIGAVVVVAIVVGAGLYFWLY